MKKLVYFLLLSILITLGTSCSTDPENEDNNSLGGDTEITLGEVGNTGYTVVEMNGQYTRLEGIEITENNNGVVNIHIDTDLSSVPELSDVSDLVSAVYPAFQDANGKLVTDLKYKITSEGIQDFNNIDGKAHTLVKYDASVGDTYTLELSNGNKLVRKVIAKSSTDDFQWGFLLIKTVTVEQNALVPGIQKYIFRANHNFGLVNVEALMEDGSTVGLYVYPYNY